MKKLIFVVCAVFIMNASAMETKKPDEFTITKAYQPSERQFLVDSLILDTKTAFDTTQKINKLFIEKIEQQNLRQKSAGEVCKVIKELRTKYEQQSPIFSLSECTQEEDGLCAMSREVRPTHRSKFEQKVVQTIVEKFKKNKKVAFTAFGCGKLFPELVILTNVLAQNPQAELDVHCIDKNYVSFCEAKTLFTKNKKPEVILQDPIEPQFFMETTLVELIKKHPDFKNDSVLLSQPFFQEIFMQEMRFEQMLGFLQKTFPKARIRIIPHFSRFKYVAYCQQNNIAPDIITAIDIDDTQSKARGSMRDYLLLCAELLKKNPSTVNLFLGRAENDPCMSVSLQKGPNAHLVPLENEQEKIELYLTSVPILN